MLQVMRFIIRQTDLKSETRNISIHPQNTRFTRKKKTRGNYIFLTLFSPPHKLHTGPEYTHMHKYDLYMYLWRDIRARGSANKQAPKHYNSQERLASSRKLGKGGCIIHTHHTLVAIIITNE